jgi:molybdate transport system substrate-binding protein
MLLQFVRYALNLDLHLRRDASLRERIDASYDVARGDNCGEALTVSTHLPCDHVLPAIGYHVFLGRIDMKIVGVTRLSAVACLVMPFLAGAALAQERAAQVKLAEAKAGDARLFVSGALRAPLAMVQEQAEKAVGHPLVMEVGESRRLQSEIEAGQPFEVALLTGPVIDDMIAKGKIVPGSRVDLAAVRVGVAVKGDAPEIDIRTPDGLKKAILSAASVRRFYGVGASVPTLDNLFTKLDLGDSLKSRIVPLGTGQPAPEPVLGPSQYEMYINLASEVIPMTGWTYLGLIPEQFQIPVVLSAGVGTAGDAKVAQALIAFLRSHAFDAALKANGMTRK